nr:MAG TPA: hypothetical protein [Bacteriophage sp.]
MSLSTCLILVETPPSPFSKAAANEGSYSHISSRLKPFLSISQTLLMASLIRSTINLYLSIFLSKSSEFSP